MKKKLIYLSFLALLGAAGCGGDDNGPEPSGNNAASALSIPANNTECLTGTDVSETQNKVTFQWNASEGTQSYYLYVKNLNTQVQLQYNAATATSYEVTLTKGTPYSWYVGARKSDGSTAKSEVWKFYNAGNATVSHAPFPADLVAPAMSSNVNGPQISLKWAGADIDNDITRYTVYMDTNTNPSTQIGTTTDAQELNGINVTSGTKYYWKIVTEDAAGNITTSQIFQFKVY